MFSSKVILATEVLLYLEPQHPDVCKQRGRDPRMLLPPGSPHRAALLAVLRRLTESRYIVPDWQSKGYLLLAEPAEVSMLHLVQLFHGDVCIGEAYDHSLTLGAEKLNTDSYKSFRDCEKGLYDSIRRRLRKILVSDFKHPRGCMD